MQYLQLIPPFFLWFFSAFEAGASAQHVAQSDSAIHIFGSCWDIATGVDLKVKAHALVNGGKVYIGESSDDGRLDLSIPRTTTELTFESKGYKTVTSPVSVQGKTKKTDKFRVSFRMISIDSQQVVQAYQPKSPTNNAANGSQQDAAATHFEVRDIYLRKLLTSKICLKFGSGQTFCVDTDSSKAPIASFVGEMENIELIVSADGYQTYTSLLKSKNMKGEALYRIHLLRESNALSLLFNVPQHRETEFLFAKNGPFSSFKPTNGQNMLIDSYNGISTIGPIQVTALENNPKMTTAEDPTTYARMLEVRKKTGSKVILEDRFSISAGLTLKAFHIESPDAAAAESKRSDVAEPVSTGSVTLYFDQSSYLLRTQSKIMLDSLSDLLKKTPSLMVSLTGHTDNVGSAGSTSRCLNTGEGWQLTTC
jgi:hypothetical protein